MNEEARIDLSTYVDEGDLIAFVARSTADEWDKIVNYPSQYRKRDLGTEL